MRYILILLLMLYFALSALPMLGAANRAWPGFFYSPFYTTNIFSDETTPAYQAGLRAEDRVIQAGALPGQWPRINFLARETSRAAELSRPVTLVYELGRNVAAISVKVERLGWNRILEKAGPLFFSGLGLALLALFGKVYSPRWRVFCALAGLALVAAPDYFLNPGNGLESGFAPSGDFGPADWLAKSGKWSTYFYAPLWKLALAAGLIYSLHILLAKRQRLFRLSLALVISVLTFDLITYGYEAILTATYNNPDYLVWHNRAAFWQEWLALGLLLTLAESYRLKLKALLPLAGFGLFLAGFAFPTTFDIALPGPGPQWYSLGLVVFFVLSKKVHWRSNVSQNQAEL